MGCIYVTFSLKSFSSSFPESFEKSYQEVYKPLLKSLYKNSTFPFAFSFSGNHLLYLKKKHSEFSTLVQELISRNQIEIYGGGFYNPVLPLLQPTDRNGQIDKLTSEIRQFAGKRPRGIMPFKSIWDSSLVTNLNSCGLEYALINESLVPPTKRNYLPLYVSELGKAIEVFYTSNEFKQASYIDDCDGFIKSIIQAVGKKTKKDDFSDANRIVNIVFEHSDIKKLINAKWFEKLSQCLENYTDQMKLTLISSFRKLKNVRQPTFIQAGVDKSIAKLIEKPFFEKEVKSDYPLTIFDFFESYPRSHALYDRMNYVSLLVNSFKGDKVKKYAARELLWAGQNGEGLLSSRRRAFLNSKERRNSYVELMEAEKTIRGSDKFKETVLLFDYNNDGENEYVCRMNDYFSYISLVSGAVRELQPTKKSGNYADNFSRIEPFDACSDDYVRGFFVDHIFTDEQFNKYINGEVAGTGIFSKIAYEPLKFSPSHHEILLKASAVCSGQKITLIKKYIVNSSGMNIQYIIKNESDRRFTSKFCVESNFANLDYLDENQSFYKVDVANAKETKELEATKYSRDCFSDGYEKNIFVVQVTDSKNGISFASEPNENCNYCFYPLAFKRPDFELNESIVVGETFVSTLFWNLEIEAGMETEKNINFSIYSAHKTKKSKN